MLFFLKKCKKKIVWTILRKMQLDLCGLSKKVKWQIFSNHLTLQVAKPHLLKGIIHLWEENKSIKCDLRKLTSWKARWSGPITLIFTTKTDIFWKSINMMIITKVTLV